MIRRPVAIALCLALVAPSCATIRKVNVFSVPEEMAVGEAFSTEVESYYPILNDPQIDWYLNHRGRQLAELSERADLPYTFNVVDSPELNAFAIPGGHLYVNLGMFEACEQEAQLVALLAHEIGHVIARHSMKQMSQQTIIQVVGTIALNQYPNQWAALAANLFGTTGFLKMSRDDEREADAIGIELMLRAGYDPRAMADVFEMLMRKYNEEPSMLDKLFATHPTSRERIENVRIAVEQMTLPPDLLTTTPVHRSTYDHVVKTYFTEAGRRRWRDMMAAKAAEDGEDKEAKDRLPWDTQSDEERKKRKEKEKAERDKKQRKREQAEARRSGATPTPTPLPAPPGTEEPGPQSPTAPDAGSAGEVEAAPPPTILETEGGQR